MSISKSKKAGAALGAVVLASSAVAAVPAFGVVQVNDYGNAAEAVENQGTTTIDAHTPVPVIGEFSYTQERVTDTSSIANVFSKAAAVLCQTMPKYVASDGAYEVTNEGDASSYLSWVKSAGKQSVEASRQLACVCASNVPGGGAAINADVSGVTIESIAQGAGVQ